MRPAPPRPGPRARERAGRIRAELRALATTDPSRDEASLDRSLDALFAQCDDYHERLFEEAGAVVRCGRGCAGCCSQMVFDVHAFEVRRIGRRLRAEGRDGEVRRALGRRIEAYDRIRRDHPREAGESLEDWTERTAVEFWKLDLPCALLDEDGACTVHDLRPWSCRRAFSLSDPQLCRGRTASHPERRFLLADPVEEIDELLGALDRTTPFDPETDRLDLALARELDHGR